MKIPTFLTTAVFILILSCKSKAPEAEIAYDLADETPIMPVEPPGSVSDKTDMNASYYLKSRSDVSVPVQKKVIKEGRMGLRVADLEKTKLTIDSILTFYEGYYAKESLNNNDYQSVYTLKIRIPSEHYEKFVAAIESGEGDIVYKDINARDVTEEFIDLETRLENKRNYLQRYKDLLKKANTVKEILEIEEKIRGIEEEIESTEGRLKYLSNLVAYSTLDLTLTKDKDFKFSPIRRDRFSERLKLSLSKGWFGFIDFLLFIIRIWPFWIISGTGYYFWRKIRKRRKMKK